MTGADIEYRVEGALVRVEGLRKTIRALEAAGVASQDLKDLMHAIGLVVVNAAQPAVPTLTGTLRSTLRAGRGKTKAVIRAGGARAPYAGVQHYGWPAHGITAHPFLTNAVNATRARTLTDLENGFEDLLRKHHLT